MCQGSRAGIRHGRIRRERSWEIRWRLAKSAIRDNFITVGRSSRSRTSINNRGRRMEQLTRITARATLIVQTGACFMNLIPEIEASHEEIKALRRTIHANPELRYEEVGTAKLVAENLERWG